MFNKIQTLLSAEKINHPEFIRLQQILRCPPIVEVETVNICNAKCAFCIYKDNIPKRQEMKPSLFEDVTSQISENGTSQFCLVPMLGDPLLDRNLLSRVQFLKTKPNLGMLRLVTNGLAFDKHSDQALIEIFQSIDRLEISLAPNKAVYKEMFGVDRFNHLIIQLSRVVDLMKNVASASLKIVFVGRACGDDYVVDKRLNVFADALCGDPQIAWTREYMDWGGKIENLPLSTPVIKRPKHKNNEIPCQYSLSPHIYQDGKVGMCACAGADEELLIGDLTNDSWIDILKAPNRLKKILSFFEAEQPDYCSKCSFYTPDRAINWDVIKGEANKKSRIEVETDTANYRQAILSQNANKASGILHLGAHIGQDAGKYNDLGKRTIWVEALPHIFERLQKNISEYPKQRALSALLDTHSDEQKTFHISNKHNGVPSSIFEFEKYAEGDKSLWPDLSLTMAESVTLPTVSLDDLLASNDVAPSDFDFWVVDLQGAELIALKGGTTSLAKCKAMYVAVSTVEGYKGGALWDDLSAFLKSQGFSPLWEPELQHDNVLFVKDDNFQSVKDIFQATHYLNHNQKRQEHLASLGLDLDKKSVLEVGAGIGDHSKFFIDRDCSIKITEVRPENIAILNQRYSTYENVCITQLDMDNPTPLAQKFDVVYCYGLLYHLKSPEQAIEFLARHSSGLLLLETCVSIAANAENLLDEPAGDYTQAFYGVGCRPNRQWLWDTLKKNMPYVYATRTQPDHPEFPLNWEKIDDNEPTLSRVVFICSQEPINSPLLLEELPVIHSLE